VRKADASPPQRRAATAARPLILRLSLSFRSLLFNSTETYLFSRTARDFLAQLGAGQNRYEPHPLQIMIRSKVTISNVSSMSLFLMASLITRQRAGKTITPAVKISHPRGLIVFLFVDKYALPPRPRRKSSNFPTASLARSATHSWRSLGYPCISPIDLVFSLQKQTIVLYSRRTYAERAKGICSLLALPHYDAFKNTEILSR